MVISDNLIHLVFNIQYRFSNSILHKLVFVFEITNPHDIGESLNFNPVPSILISQFVSNIFNEFVIEI